MPNGFAANRDGAGRNEGSDPGNPRVRATAFRDG